jgi:hypothetical protein
MPTITLGTVSVDTGNIECYEITTNEQVGATFNSDMGEIPPVKEFITVIMKDKSKRQAGEKSQHWIDLFALHGIKECQNVSGLDEDI